MSCPILKELAQNIEVLVREETILSALLNIYAFVCFLTDITSIRQQFAFHFGPVLFKFFCSAEYDGSYFCSIVLNWVKLNIAELKPESLVEIFRVSITLEDDFIRREALIARLGMRVC